MREGGRDLLILLLLLLIGDKAPKPPKYVLKMGDRRKWHNKWSLCQNFWWSYWQSFYCVLVWRVQACSLYHVSYIIDQSESSHSCCYSIGTNCIDFKNKILDKYSHYYPNFNCKYWEVFVTHFVFFFLNKFLSWQYSLINIVFNLRCHHSFLKNIGGGGRDIITEKFGNILIEKVFLPTKAEKYSLSVCVRNFEREKKNTREHEGE